LAVALKSFGDCCIMCNIDLNTATTVSFPTTFEIICQAFFESAFRSPFKAGEQTSPPCDKNLRYNFWKGLLFSSAGSDGVSRKVRRSRRGQNSPKVL
jgi:hypothetical protein